MFGLNKKEISWIFNDVANSAQTLIVTTAIMPIFFKSIASKGIDPSVATANLGFTNSLASLILAFAAPFLGALADNKNAKKKFFYAFTLLGIVSTALLATIGEGDWMQCMMIYLFSSLGFYGATIFYDSLLVDVTTDERMDKVSSFGFGFGYIGSVIPFIFCMALIVKPELFGLSGSLVATQIAFIITAAWWFIFSLPLMFNVQQIHYVEKKGNAVLESLKRLGHTLKNASEHKNIFLFLLAYFFYIDGVYTIIKMATAYGIDMGLNQTYLLVIVLVIQIVAFPFAILFGILSKKFGVKTMLFAGIVIYGIISILGFSINYMNSLSTKLLFFWIMAFLVAAAQGGIQSLSRSFYGKIIPKDKSAEFFSFYDIFGKFASIMGPTLMGVASLLTGSSHFGVLSLVVLFVFGGFFLSKVKMNEV